MERRPASVAVFVAGILALAPGSASPLLRLGTAVTPGAATDVEIANGLAYVADGYSGLRIVDVLPAATPEEVGFLDTPGFARGVDVEGSLAYVADGSSLLVIDVSHPSAPLQIGALTPPAIHAAMHVDVVGNLAYLAGGGSGLHIVDVSVPSAPVQIGNVDTPGFANEVVVSGTRAYLADWDRGLRVINVANPAAPTSTVHYNSPGYARGLDVSGTTVYLADSADVRILDATLFPTVLLGVFDPPGTNVHDVGLDGNVAYVAEWYVRAVDVANPATPVEIDVSPPLGQSEDVEVDGAFVYVVADGDLEIFLSNAPACSNGIDDDGDGFLDFPDDPGCLDADSNLENPECQDGVDNDGRPGTDFDGGESILGAGNGDSDGPDPQCLNRPWKGREKSSGCGLGFELAPIAAALAWRRRRRARRD